MEFFERIFKNWKTTVGALLCLALFFWAYYEGVLPEDEISKTLVDMITGAVSGKLLFSKDKKEVKR